MVTSVSSGYLWSVEYVLGKVHATVSGEPPSSQRIRGGVGTEEKGRSVGRVVKAYGWLRLHGIISSGTKDHRLVRNGKIP